MHHPRFIHRAAWLAATALCTVASTPTLALAASAANAHLHGRIVSVSGDSLTLRLRDGKQQTVDISAARAAHHTGVLPIGGAVIVYGTRDAAGTFHVLSVGHTSPDAKQWTADD